MRLTGIVDDVDRHGRLGDGEVEHPGAVAGHPLGNREPVVGLRVRAAADELGEQAAISRRVGRAVSPRDVPLDGRRAVVAPPDLRPPEPRPNLLGQRQQAGVREVHGLAARLPPAAGAGRRPDAAADPASPFEHDDVGAVGHEPVGSREAREAGADHDGVMHRGAPRPRRG